MLALSTGRPLQALTAAAAQSIHRGWLATRPEYAHAHFNSRKRMLRLPRRQFDDLDEEDDGGGGEDGGGSEEEEDDDDWADELY